MTHHASPTRYENLSLYRRCGRSGLVLPKISLGLWHNFGAEADFGVARALVLRAFDLGVTHFDLANNYGPPPGTAEETFGRILRQDLAAYRDEIVVSTKAGWRMWPGPYGEWGSRKHLLASLDQSLKRLGLETVDIYYSHRPDPDTPFEETMAALGHAVRAGKALYAGISSYDAPQTQRAAALLDDLGAPCLIHQPRYNIFDREPESELFDVLRQTRIGAIAFCPLAQGLLTNRYLRGIPSDSRAGGSSRFLRPTDVTAVKLATIRQLDELARARGQTLAQMALTWVLRDPVVVSALIGASRVAQLDENLRAVDALPLSPEELSRISAIVSQEPVGL